tara:strand:- start:974 stop:1636 length:663 start_codon:yes stop_codon:yes gene_type:complete
MSDYDFTLRPLWSKSSSNLATHADWLKVHKSPGGVPGFGITGGLTEFQESINSDFKMEKFYGRSDPVVSFGGNTRDVTLAFLLEGGQSTQAEVAIEQAKKMLYPIYEENENNALRVASVPLVLAHHARLKSGTKTGEEEVVAVLKGFTFNSGVGITPIDSPNIRLGSGVSYGRNGEIIPNAIDFKKYTLAFSLTILHSTTLGWKPGNGPLPEWVGGGVFD